MHTASQEFQNSGDYRERNAIQYGIGFIAVGVWTIGFGRNLESNPLSKDEGRVLLDNDIRRAVTELRQKCPVFIGLDTVRREVLVNMAFNLGWPRLSGFVRMFACLEAEDYGGAALEMLDSKWADQVGGRAIGLAERMRTGAVS